MKDSFSDGGVRRTARLLTPLLAGIVVLVVVVSATAGRHRAAPATASSASAPVSSPSVSSAPLSSAPVSSAPVVHAPASLSVKAAQWRDGGEAVITPTNPPASTMIDGANDLLAVGTTLLAATEQGLALSTDRGSTWRYVLTGVDMWSLTRAGDGFTALGRHGGPDDNGSAVIATSSDGVKWQLLDPTAPQSEIVAFGYGDRIVATGIDAHAVDVAVPDIVATSWPGETLRSVNGGRTWQKVNVSLTTGIDVLPDGKTMYATGSTDSCQGGVYRSTDVGASWTLLPSSCQDRPLYAVTFVDAEHGFAAGGTPEKYDGSDIVEATDDGGQTWQVRWSTPLDPGIDGGGGGQDNEIVRLDFADAEHGYAVTGGCVDGQNGPCGGNLYVTSDAGHTWELTGRAGLGVAAVGTNVYLSELPQRGGPSLAISTDAGQHWTLQSSAAQVNSQTVAGTGKTLWWQTNIGIFTSDDAGNHWSPSIAAAIRSLPMYADPLQAAPPSDLLALVSSTGEIWSSTDNARTARQSALGGPTDGVEAVALGPNGRAAAIVGYDDNCDSPQLAAKMTQVKPGWVPESRQGTLYLSSDAGGHWNTAATLPYLFASFAPGSLAIGSSLIAAIDACANLELSSDSGRSWATVTPSHADSGCTVALQGKEIWLDCPANIAHSTDAGATWTSYVTNPGGVDWLSQPLEPVGPDTAIVSVSGSLWRTTDGGAHWTQSWPQLVGES